MDDLPSTMLPHHFVKYKWSSIQLCIHLVRIVRFMSGGICFMSFNLFIYLFFVILKLLWHDCNILFVALFMSLSYEEKRLAQHWTMHNWHIHWPVAFMTQNTHVPKADILNTWQKSVCVEKQRNNILHEHLLQLNVFQHFELNYQCCKAVYVITCFSQGSAATDLRGGVVVLIPTFPADPFWI